MTKVPAPRADIDLVRAVHPRGARTLVMGVLNVTPDSFSDGGRFDAADAAAAQARSMIAAGADVVDIGGESTRPGHTPVAAEDEIARVAPALAALGRDCPVPVSIDTWKAPVAAAAIEAGASIVNDVWGFQRDPDIARVAAANGAACVLMHNAAAAEYGDVVADVRAFLARSARIALAAGIAENRILLDPGVGFAKTSAHNLALLRRWEELKTLGFPLLLGASRKRVVGRLLIDADGRDRPVDDRDAGTLALKIWTALRHRVDMVRVHDVAAHADAMRVIARLEDARFDGTAPQ